MLFNKNGKVFKHLYDHLALQAISKAGEIKLDLDMWDLHTSKAYLNGYTLEQVIHGITSINRPGIPIVKHITKKWSREPDKLDYQIAVAPCMLQDAHEMLKTIRASLVTKFGTEVQKHFVDSICILEAAT